MQNKVSGKPDAGEWARKYESSAKPLEVFLANFQRETLLWIKEDCVACAEIEMGHDSVLAARIANRLRTVLEREAESCGRGK